MEYIFEICALYCVRMPDSGKSIIGWLAAKADQYEDMAFRAGLYAKRIEGELSHLKTCLDPVKNLHTVQVWDSKAATYSRQKLNGFHTYHLNSLTGQLAQLAENLRSHSYLWAQNAENFWGLSRTQA